MSFNPLNSVEFNGFYETCYRLTAEHLLDKNAPLPEDDSLKLFYRTQKRLSLSVPSVNQDLLLLFPIHQC